MDDDYTIDAGSDVRLHELDALFAQWTGAEAGTAATLARPPVPMPESATVTRDGETLTITQRWLQPVTIFVVVFAVVWNAIVLAFTAVFTRAGGAIALFMVPFWLAGAFVVYSALTGLFNSTRIIVRPGLLAVEHSPLPWPGAVSIDAGSIDQLYTREVRNIHTSSSSSRVGRAGGRRSTHISYTYDVVVMYGDPLRETRLVKGLVDAHQALFIEYTVERFLGIPDRPIRGELRRDG